MKKRLTVGVITAECYREYTAETMCGILAQAARAGCNVIVLSPRNNFQAPISPHVAHEADVFSLLTQSTFDGFLYDQKAFADQTIQKRLDGLLKRTGKPVMMLDSQEHPFFENTVSHDPDAFAMLVEHMIVVHGHTRIYCLTGPKGMPQAEDRLEAYRHVMQRHGLHCDETCYAYGDFWRDAPVAYAQRLLSGALPMPEAIVCANDVMADALIDALGKGGVRVPEDVAVTGFDGCLDPNDALTDVTLTSYPHSCYQLGADAFRRLYSIITGRSCRRIPGKHSHIQIGRSCGCVPTPRPSEKSRRETRLRSQYEGWAFHSEVLFELLHTASLEALLHMIASRIYLVCHWGRFRVFLNASYLHAVRPERPLPAHKDLCEVLSVDHAGKAPGVEDHPLREADLIAYLTEEHGHPSAWYVSPLHMDERPFGYAALSFGKLAHCYAPVYCTLLSYLCLAFDQLEEKGRLRAQCPPSLPEVEDSPLYRGLAAIRDEMQQHPEADWSIAVLCDRTHVSRSYLQKMYKRYFDRSIFEDLIAFRLQRAKALLADTDLTLSEIAERCGYASYAHLAKQFKANEGVTLSAYRAQAKGEDPGR